MEAVIKNLRELRTTELRQDALAILEAGYEETDTPKVLPKYISINDGVLKIKDLKLNLRNFERIFVIGIGKCALDVSTLLEGILGEYLTGGIILDVRGGKLNKLKSEIGTHPLPSEKNIAVTKSIAELLESLNENDLVLTVISGGGSALLCLPSDESGETVAQITDQLMNKGAPISEINTVRKHLSKIKGGQFAKLAYPARVVSIIFSDVPGDDISIIASGPTVKDKTTIEDAKKVLKKYKIKGGNLVETPKEDKYFEKVDNIILLGNQVALKAMAAKAKSLAYDAEIISAKIEGDANELGPEIVREATETRKCRLYGGESTVVVKNPKGKGGRNQHIALAALPEVGEEIIFVAAASDGCDNGDVAGAIADEGIMDRASSLGLDYKKFLAENNSYEFFRVVSGHIQTGKTGENVADFYFTLHK